MNNTINVSHIRYIGEEGYQEMRGYDQINYENPGWVLFIWVEKEEVVSINASRIAEIVSTVEEV
jgi:hypothetical protein